MLSIALSWNVLFVYMVNKSTNHTTVYKKRRWFIVKAEGENLPPTSGWLYLHIRRAHYTESRDLEKSTHASHQLLHLVGHLIEAGSLLCCSMSESTSSWGSTIPDKCGWKCGRERRCSCRKNIHNVPCTEFLVFLGFHLHFLQQQSKPTSNKWGVWIYVWCPLLALCDFLHFYRAMHFSARRGLAIACRPSARPSVCDVGGLWSHRLEILETNCTDN